MQTSTDLTTRENKVFSLTPSDLNQAMQLAEIMAASEMVPKVYQGKPGNVLIAVQMGADLGFSPTQALQSIAVINGNPAVWGDGLRALVMGAPDLADMEEWYDPESKTAYCTIKRKLKSGKVVSFQGSFSIKQAQTAGLTSKGPWKQYPERMLQWRALGYAARDAYADRLKGIKLAEEVQDYPEEKFVGTNRSQPIDPKAVQLGHKPDPESNPEPEQEPEPEPEKGQEPNQRQMKTYNSWIDSINGAESVDDLKSFGERIAECGEKGLITPEQTDFLRGIYGKKMKELSEAEKQ